MMADTIKIPAAVLKSDLPGIREHWGKANAIEIHEVTPAGMFVFETFAGRLDTSGEVTFGGPRYVGHYVFRRLTPEEQKEPRERFDFATLPNLLTHEG
jgi:hypothetical protein